MGGLTICMRSAGLSVESMVEYVSLFQEGDSTIYQRIELLNQQMEILRKKREDINDTINKLSHKISLYKQTLNNEKISQYKE